MAWRAQATSETASIRSSEAGSSSPFASSGPIGPGRFAPDSAPARWEDIAGADYCSGNPETGVLVPAARDASWSGSHQRQELALTVRQAENVATLSDGKDGVPED